MGPPRPALKTQALTRQPSGRILRLLDMRDAGAISGAPLTAPYRHNRIFRRSDAAVNPMGPRPVVTTFGFPFMARRAGIWRHQTPALGVATCAANCWTESSFCKCRSRYVPTLNRVMPIATVAGLCDSSITPPQDGYTQCAAAGLPSGHW